jgi:hypothetical protein
MAENIAKHFFFGDFAGNFSYIVEHLAKFKANKVVRESGVQTFIYIV